MAKRKAEHHSLGEVLKEYIASKRKLAQGLDRVSAKEAWYRVMGETIAKYTTEVTLDRDVLYVQLTSSVLREELSYGKAKIIKMLNEELQKELITKLILR